MLAFKALCSAVPDDKLFYLIVDKLHTTVLAGFHKSLDDILCVVAYREHSVATLSFKLHTKALKKAHNVLWSKSAQPVPENPADPVLNKPRKVAQEGVNSFPYWEKVVQQLQEKDPMLYTYLRKSKAYFDGTRVLIDGGKTFRDFIRANKDSQRLIKKLIKDVSGVAVPIGPYEPKNTAKHTSNAEQSLHALEKLGLEVTIEDTERKKKS